MKKKAGLIRFAGISMDGNDEIQFHSSSSERVGVTLSAPGSGYFEYIKLPREMDKIAAVRHMLKHPKFKSRAIQRFLKDQLLRREAGLPAQPRLMEVKEKIMSRRNGHRQRIAA